MRYGMKTLASLLLSGMIFSGCDEPSRGRYYQKLTPFNMADGTNFVEYMIVDVNQDGSWDFIAENVPGKPAQKIVILKDKMVLTNSLEGYEVSNDASIANSSISSDAGFVLSHNRYLRKDIEKQLPLLLHNKIITNSISSTNLNTP